MAGHVYHESLPGYDQRQIWHDGCAECERRTDPEAGLAHLNSSRFVRAWKRAVTWQTSDSTTRQSLAISRAEAPLLRTLFAVGQQLNQLDAYETAFVLSREG